MLIIIKYIDCEAKMLKSLFNSIQILMILSLMLFAARCNKNSDPIQTKSDNKLLHYASQEVNSETIVLIETNKGNIKCRLKDNDAPKTVANFVKLIKQNFYDGLTFHRVEKGFVIQGGDPLGNGTGSAEDDLELEIKCKDGRMINGETAPRDCVPAVPHLRGTLSMARSKDPNSASCQFFITLGPTPFLDRNYAGFGYVIEGMDVVDSIVIGDKMTKVSILP